MFKDMADQLTARFSARDLKITITDFEHWQKRYTWDALKNISYGKSFCKYFQIYDAKLMLMQWHPDLLEQYILEAYVDRSSI
jgi:hypothetical protein